MNEQHCSQTGSKQALHIQRVVKAQEKEIGRPQTQLKALNPLASTDFFGRYNRYYGGGTVVFRGV
jgi:hypothetical protein